MKKYFLFLLTALAFMTNSRATEPYTAYLFAYFTGNSGNEEAIRFATSYDGYNFLALNGGSPIIGSDSISDMKGVRDPHILRGADGETFYMVVTDMKSALGWSSNHGIVLLKSTDLVNWTHSRVDIKTRFPAKFGNITRAWAPQTIYDPSVGKYMIYFSMNSATLGRDIIHYAYANADFTDLETEPQVLFNHPTSAIDGDIIYKDGKYHLFFKTEGSGNGIKKAVSTTLNSGYSIVEDRYLQQTTDAVEGSCVYQLINSDTYILMYDCYTTGRYEFTESTDLSNFCLAKKTMSMDFTPRHGTVIPITTEEATRLANKWAKTASSYGITSGSPQVKKNSMIVSTSSPRTATLPVKRGTDLSAFDPQMLASTPGVSVTPSGVQDFTQGSISYKCFSSASTASRTYAVSAHIAGNPVIDGFYADPQVLYAKKTGKYYIYPTADGFSGWGGFYFDVFSSDDLVEWKNEGTIINQKAGDVAWANGNAWAPAIVEKLVNGQYKYYFYFSGNPVAGGGKQIGVAVADNPTGPFTARTTALLTTSPTGGGQQIDPCVFTDPVSGKSYIYYGNGYMAVAELNDDMISIKSGTTKVITPSGGSLSDYAYREGAYVFYRNGKYYFMWSVDDTGATNYHVAYGTSSSPTGPITVAASPIVIIQDAANKIYGTGHNSVLQIPDKDEWYIVYHRINPNFLNDGPGYHREVCIDSLTFNADGTIRRVKPTIEGVPAPGSLSALNTPTHPSDFQIYPNPVKDMLHIATSGWQDLSSGLTATIADVSGKICVLKNLSATEAAIDCSQLDQGFYMLNLRQGMTTKTIRFIKI